MSGHSAKIPDAPWPVHSVNKLNNPRQAAGVRATAHTISYIYSGCLFICPKPEPSNEVIEMKFENIQAISEALNKFAVDHGFFNKPAVEIDRNANDFVKEFAETNGLEAHTVTPDRWWFSSKEFGMYEDGEVELHPMIKHAVESLHPHDNKVPKEFRFVLVPKLTEDEPS